MGATAGHMLHPYENLDLTFDQMRGMFDAASKGFPKLKVTEKTDGQNIAIGYDPESGQTLAIRNKAHATAGGLDKESLKKYFTTDRLEAGKNPTPMNVVDSFYDAMQNFERIARTLPPEFFITPEGERIFYNAEVMDPRSANVVDYDTQVLLIHRVGHKKLTSTGMVSFEASEAEQRSIELESRLLELQAASPEISTIKVNAIVDFTNFIEKKEAYRAAANELRVLQGSAKTVGEYLENAILDRLSSTIGTNYSEETRQLILKALMRFATKGMPRVKAEINPVLDSIPDPKKQALIKDFLTKRAPIKAVVDGAMHPLMMIVHNFATRLLEGFISGYTLQADVSLEKLRKKIGAKARELSDPADLKLLRTSLAKIHGGQDIEDVLSDEALEAALERITTSVEGLVFDYDGMTYKFTGQFAPVNQMLGLGKYDRGPKKESPPGNRDDELLEVEEEFDRRRLIALVPGAFKPPHAGHFEMVRHYSEMVGPDGFVYVLISPLPRGGGKEDEAEVRFDESKNIWDIYIQSAGLNNVVIYDKPSESNSPVGQAAEYIENKNDNLDFAQPGDEIILGCSDKADDKGNPDYARFGDPGSFQKYAREGAMISDHVAGCFRTSEGAISATDFRRALHSDGDVSPFIPRGVDQERVKGIFGNLQEQKKTISLLYSLVEELLQEKYVSRDCKKKTGESGDCAVVSHKTGKQKACYDDCDTARAAMHEEELDEVSAMGGAPTGAVEIGAGSPRGPKKRRKKKKKKETLIREVLNYLEESGIMEIQQ